MDNKPKLSSFSSLLKGAIGDYKAHFKVFFILSLIALLLELARWFIFLPGIAVLVIPVVLLVVICIINGAIIYAAKDKASIRESLEYILKNTWSFLWVVLLAGLIIAASYFPVFATGIAQMVCAANCGTTAHFISPIISAAFLAFGVLNIILILLITLAPFILMDEGLKGASAIIRSREYVKGYVGALFARYGLYALVCLIPVAVICRLLAMIKPGIGITFIFLATTIITAPISICFSWRIYRDLKEKRPEIAAAPVSKNKAWVIFLAIAGLLSSVVYAFAIYAFMNIVW